MEKKKPWARKQIRVEEELWERFCETVRRRGKEVNATLRSWMRVYLVRCNAESVPEETPVEPEKPKEPEKETNLPQISDIQRMLEGK